MKKFNKNTAIVLSVIMFIIALAFLVGGLLLKFFAFNFTTPNGFTICGSLGLWFNVFMIIGIGKGRGVA